MISEQHLKWVKYRRNSTLFDFIKPQKEFEKPKKIRRIKNKIRAMRDVETDEDV